VLHGSTVLYPTAEDLHAHRAEFTYALHGSPTTRALQDVLMSLEGPQCAGVGLTPSGLAAITTTLLSVLSAGDHVLVTDNVYRPRPISATACSSAPASRSAISIR
jgi:cysteine-S-conjugate beta-lyase